LIIDLLRHGEPLGGVRYRGNGIDDPLSDRGWRQMWRAVGEAPGQWSWRAVLSSPMQRCQAFAEALCERRQLPLNVVRDLREIGFGEWEGLAPDVVRSERTSEHRAFLADPAAGCPPGAEPLGAFRSRVQAVLTERCGSTEVEHLLVVAHAGVIRAAVGWVLQIPDGAFHRLRCDYASLTRICRDSERGWRVEFANRSR
jgi:alpha-ribazole phosphatase/probable phosphoglycerate mutase